MATDSEAKTPSAQRALRDIEFHRLTAGSYDDSVTREHAIYHAHSLAHWLDRLEPRGEATALDLGCGTGVVSLALAARGFRVVGIDHSPHMLEIARRKAEAAGLAERVALREGDVLDPGLAPGSADAVTIQGLLHHLDDLEPCIAVTARTLRPGGAFYISEPCADPAPPGRLVQVALRLAVALRRRLRRGPRAVAPDSGEAPIRWAALAAALDSHGLEYEAEFITHVPEIHRFVPDRVRLAVELAVSRPWRRTRGDLVFVRGRRPPA